MSSEKSPREEQKRQIVAYVMNLLISPREYRRARIFAIDASKRAKDSPKLTSCFPDIENKLGRALPRVSDLEIKSKEPYRSILSLWRSSSRLYISTYIILKLINHLKTKVLRRPSYSSNESATATSVTMMLIVYRIMFKVTSNIHRRVTYPQAKAFRRKYKKVATIIKSDSFPSTASGFLAGLCLIFHKEDKIRTAVTFYVATLAAEALYDSVMSDIDYKIMGHKLESWMLFPLSYGQLFYSFIYERDCCPESFKRFMIFFSPERISQVPDYYPKDLPYPSETQILDSLTEIIRDKCPPFNSPILYPNSYVLPSKYQVIDPIVSQAHPGIRHLSCALLHPYESSCLMSYINDSASTFKHFARYTLPLYGIIMILKSRKLITSQASVSVLLSEFIRSTLFISMIVSTSWAGICNSQQEMQANRISSARIRLVGFVAGLWACIDKSYGRAKYIPIARMGFETYLKSLKQKGYIKNVRHGDVIVFAISFAILMRIFNQNQDLIFNKGTRKALSTISGKARAKTQQTVRADSTSNKQE
ncbi:hypothetical protein V1511DRAFT_499958 [Dipodascopsis uninucleata]